TRSRPLISPQFSNPSRMRWFPNVRALRGPRLLRPRDGLTDDIRHRDGRRSLHDVRQEHLAVHLPLAEVGPGREGESLGRSEAPLLATQAGSPSSFLTLNAFV